MVFILFFIIGQWIKEPGIRVEDGSVPYVVSVGDTAYRLYYCGMGGIKSAVSTDGLNFVYEPGVRITPGASSDSMEKIVADPTVVKIENGYRMYYKGATGSGGPGQARHRIFSAISSEGLNWTKEGLRYENLGPPDYGWTSVPDAIKLPDGRIRIYYNSAGIRSIISSDGLNFTSENGVRLDNCVDPNVICLADSSYRMFFATQVAQPQHIGYAESKDGLNWSIIDTIISPAGPYDSLGCVDPSAIILPDGRTRVYYGGLGTTKVVTLSAISSVGIEIPDNSKQYSFFKIYPNPSRGLVQFLVFHSERLNIYDSSGRLIKLFLINNSGNAPTTIYWDPKGLKSGIYFCQLIYHHSVETRNLILLSR